MMELDSGSGRTRRDDSPPDPRCSFPETHPARLAAIGRLHGLAVADPANARFLELGCGGGINLLAMAQIYPLSEFVGIALSENHLRTAFKACETTCIPNARFIHADLLKLEEELGLFDYIICKDLYSRVSASMRKDILGLCLRSLKKNGMAFANYKCLPGWTERDSIREMITRHTEVVADPKARIAKARKILSLLADSVPEDHRHGKFLRREAIYLKGLDDQSIARDYFSPAISPFYLQDFVSEVSSQGLHYLGNADPGQMGGEELPPKVRLHLRKLVPERIPREQYLDYLQSRLERSCLLCHQGTLASEEPHPSHLQGLQVTARIRIKQPFRDGRALFFEKGGGDFEITHPVYAALLSKVAALGTASIDAGFLIGELIGDPPKGPGHSPKAGLEDVRVEELQRIVLEAWHRSWIDLSLGPIPSSAPISDTLLPEALPLARWQVSSHERVSTTDLSSLFLDDFLRTFIGLCDGTKGKESIISGLVEAFGRKDFEIRLDKELISDEARARNLFESRFERVLGQLSDLGLLRPRVLPGLEYQDFAARVRWRMTHDRNPIFPILQDKVAVKKYAAERGVSVAKMLFETTNPEDIPFSNLPEPYFIKANHGSGWNFLSEGGHLHFFRLGEAIMNPDGTLVEESQRAKSIITREECVRICRQLLDVRYATREWAYHKIIPRILVEEKLRPANGGELLDYRFYTFDGIVRAISIGSPSYRRDRMNVFLTPEWDVIKLTISNERLPDPLPKRPDKLPEMIHAAEKLGKGIDFVRVDLYDTDLGVMLGEMTLYPKGGLPHTPTICNRFNRWLGNCWVHPDHPKSFRNG